MSKLEATASIGTEIKEGLIEMGKQLASAAGGGRASTELSDVAAMLKEQAQQSAKQAEETHNLLRLLLQTMVEKNRNSN